MILYFFQGFIVITLIFGVFLTFKKKNWRMLGVFSFFLLGNLYGLAIPFLFQAPNDMDSLKIFVYVHSVRYLLYLTAILILINLTMKKNGS
ncbi:hypothetical protein EBB07_22430 [Paenibacillaceae bacterium]|nr:hypothetical protein EBB07_22430 [Paenibacillaceae bacterium]